MNTYEIEVRLTVRVDAFSLSDAKDAVLEDLADVADANVVDVAIDSAREVD